MNTNRLLVAVPFGVLVFWLAATELVALITRADGDADRVMIGLLLIGAVLAVGSVLVVGLMRGRHWAWWWSLSIGLLFSVPFLLKGMPENVPLGWFGIVAGLATAAGAFLAHREFLKPTSTRAPVVRDAAHHPAP